MAPDPRGPPYPRPAPGDEAGREGDGMDITMVLLFVGIGTIPGFWVGRWSAETRRAHYDMDNVWNGRRRYRE